jgi:hypothetical protein
MADKLIDFMTGPGKGAAARRIRRAAVVWGATAALVFYPVISSAQNETYSETFDGREEGATINEVAGWQVPEGDFNSAVTQSGDKFGAGKSLKLRNAAPAVVAVREDNYGSLSPVWVEYLVNPARGVIAPPVPEGKIMALNFAPSGQIMASDGGQWVDTGREFSPGEWYRARLRLDFSSHVYDLEISDPDDQGAAYRPVLSGLAFIDPSVNKLSALGFQGAYNAEDAGQDTYVDGLVVHFVSRLGVITPPQTVTRDTPSNAISVQLQDALSDPQKAWKDIILELASSSAEGEFSLGTDPWSPVTQVVVSEEGTEAVFYYKDHKLGESTITVREWPDAGWDDVLLTHKTIMESAYFDVIIESPQIAGHVFKAGITARTIEGLIDQGYGEDALIRTVYVSGEGEETVKPLSVSGFAAGILETDLSYADAGTIQVRVVNPADSAQEGISGEVLFLPDHFRLETEEKQVVGRPFEVAVVPVNDSDEVTPGYLGPVTLGVEKVDPDSGDGGITPGAIPTEDFGESGATATMMYDRWGTVKLTAHDTVYPDQAGESAVIMFHPARVTLELQIKPRQEFFYAGESINIYARALGHDDTLVPNYAGTVTVSASPELDLDPEYTFSPSEGGKHGFIVTTFKPGEYNLSVEDKAAGAASEKVEFKVKAAILEVISVTAPLGTAEVFVKLVDEEGKVIETENEMQITIVMEELNPDGSASFVGNQNTAVFSKGLARFLISNSEEEEVTITPYSSLDLAVRKGTVTFSKLSNTGVGIMMWKEKKD